MNAEQKIANIEAQMRAAREKRTNVITCPYCAVQNIEENESVCCPLFAAAVTAILHRWDTQTRLDQVARVADMASRN